MYTLVLYLLDKAAYYCRAYRCFFVVAKLIHPKFILTQNLASQNKIYLIANQFLFPIQFPSPRVFNLQVNEKVLS
jgi:hypothetical protein